MSVSPIKWHSKPERVDADPGATLTLDRSAWEKAGATFTPTGDGNGETPGLAAATVKTPAGPVEIGVVDYDEPTTYLLVPGAGSERLLTTVAVLKTLESVGALEIQKDLLDLADVAPQPTLEDRVAELERQLIATGLAKTPTTSGYVALDTEIATNPSEPDQAKTPARTGKVVWMNDDRGFGFIQPEDGEKDILIGRVIDPSLHVSALVELDTFDHHVIDILGAVTKQQPVTRTRRTRSVAKRRAAKKP